MTPKDFGGKEGQNSKGNEIMKNRNIHCKRIIPASILAIVITAAIGLAPSRLAASQTIYVTGTINESVLGGDFTPNGLEIINYDVWTGSLVGEGLVHVFGGGADCTRVDCTNAMTTRRLFTSEGNLFLNGVGGFVGTVVNEVDTVAGGTGICNGATGQLTLQGIRTPGVGVVFTYTGSITLQD
jgi:hypothetical protein